jgi:hypothetical protein
MATSQRSRLALAVFAGMCAVFAAVRIAAVAGRAATRLPDTAGYLDLSFVGHGRPWAVPLLYQVFASDGARVVAQCAVGIVCWCALAYVVGTLVSRAWLQAVAVAGVLLVGAAPQVSRWDLSIASESFALSFTVAALAAWLLLVARPTPVRLGFVWLATLLWVFTREAHLVLLPVIVVLFGVSLFWRAERRRRMWLVVALVPIALWGVVTVLNDRAMSEYNTYGLIELRVLGRSDRTQWFVDHGMPVNAQIAASKTFVPRGLVPASLLRDARVPVGLNPPELVVRGGRPFVRWMRDDGPSTYLEWLATHPVYTLQQPLANIDMMVVPALDRLTPMVDARPVYPSFVTEVVFESGLVLVLLLVAALLVTLVLVLRHRANRFVAFAWCVAALGVALLYVSWHGAAIEIGRHAIVASVTLRLGAFLALVFGVDRLLSARTTGPSAAAESCSSARLVSR